MSGIPPVLSRVAGVAAALVAILAGAAACWGVSPATAAQPRVVASPAPGQVVTRHRVTLAVRAGNEHGDLRVRLNGRSIGDDFPMGRGGVRRLQVSTSHGLRHGRNVLRVQARRGVVTRTATVRFTVRRTAPLVGAGRDRTVTVGQPLQLGGRIVRASGGRGARRVTWKLARAPRGSRARMIAAVATPGKGRTALAAAGGRRVVAPTSALRPAMTPDKVGTYTVQVKEGAGRSAQVDTVTVNAIPADPLVPFDAQVPPATSSTGAAQPGVRVNAATYRMPYLGFENGQGAYASGGACCTAGQFYAAWQVVAVDRSTLEPIFNRTYGWCRVGGAWQYCRSPDDPDPGQPYRPVVTDPKADMLQLAPARGVGGPAGALMIGRTTGQATPAGRTGDYEAILRQIGYPENEFTAPTPIATPTSIIGVPGMDPGDATVSARTDGELPGWLTYDQNDHYHYLSNVRPQFDTRSAQTCTADDVCRVSQTFGGQTVTFTLPQNRSGYLVSGWDPVTLAPTGSLLAVMDGTAPDTGDAARMRGLLNTLQGKGSIVAITSVVNGDRVTPLIAGAQDDWDAIADTVAQLGGTKNGFLRTASAGESYTMVGWGGAGEGNGREAGGQGVSARLRGSFAPAGRADMSQLRGGYAPGQESLLRPANVSSVGPAAERLAQLALRPTATDWKYPDASTGPGAAIQCIGAALQQGVDIRGQYVNLTTTAAANSLHDSVADLARGALVPVPGTTLTCNPTAADYATAQRQLEQELDWVAKVRTYLADLSTPSLANSDTVWSQATLLGDQLQQQLTDDAAEQATIADSIGLAAAMLDLLVPGIDTAVTDASKITNAVSAAAATMWLAGQGLALAADGGADVSPNVAANDLAATLQVKAQNMVAAFVQLGDIVVSDPDKLAEVGGSANCAAGVPGGCKPGMEEYAGTAAEIADLTNVSVRAMGRTLYSSLVPLIYGTWNTGVTADPANVYTNFDCAGTRSPFDDVPSSAYAPSLDYVAVKPDPLDPPKYRIYLMIRSATGWDWAPPAVTDRMYGPIGTRWDNGGLAMDPLKTIRDSTQPFTPGSYTCVYDN